MPNLENSQRRLFKATYAPLTIDASQAKTGRAVEKMTFIRSLNLHSSEMPKLAADESVKSITVPSTPTPGQASVPLLNFVFDFASDTSASALQRFGPALARVSFNDLAIFGTAVANERRAKGSPLVAAPVPSAADIDKAVKALTFQGPIQAVGQIHLERLEMTPVGVEHGELVHSVPLTPGETVNLTHREWSVTTQTFESLVQDSLDNFSETGVTEKSDLSQASDVEAKHSSSLDVNGSVSASYSGGTYSLTASAGIDYQQQNDTRQTEKDSKAHSMAITRNASARTRKEHKTSFRVSSVAGTENLSVEVLTNPSQTDAMRVDYYQLLRKWRVDLLRYGLRMTYDLVVPNPGIDLIEEVLQLQQVEEALNQGFAFTLNPNEITRDTWTQMAQKFGAQVDPPPKDPLQNSQFSSVQPSIDKWSYASVQFDVPDGYEIASGHFYGVFSLYDTSTHHLQVNVLQEPPPAATTNVYAAGKYQGEFTKNDAVLDFDLSESSIVKKTGSVSLTYDYHNLDAGYATVRVNMSPTADYMLAWQMKVWNQLREAAQAAYEANAARMKDLKSQLEAKIAALDSLTLRKMEREEVMKQVLQWLLGPSYSLMPPAIVQLVKANVPIDPVTKQPVDLPSGTYAFPNPNKPLDDASWHEVLAWGELIKFIHNAIEWENVIFFVYPYFWDYSDNWPFKRFLLHPDAVHRDFLRAGCTRVVLPVRPGFEVGFAMLLETGDPTQPPDTTFPYVTIGQETRNLAMTNYENVPPANPDRNARTLLHPIQQRAWADIQLFMRALAAYFEANATYPPSLSDKAFLDWAQANKLTLPANLDPWKNPYQYTFPGLNDDYDLVSYGQDGKPDGDDLDADITSWAEGSIVGRWYEYTPTSALDIAITMIPADQADTKLSTKPQPA
jgi:hypothetical protein